MENRDLARESYDFISKNIDITSDKVPDHLRMIWMVSDIERCLDEGFENTFQWILFMYVLLKSKIMHGISEVTVTPQELCDKYINWQIMLAAADVNARTEVNILPFKMFDIDNFKGITQIP